MKFGTSKYIFRSLVSNLKINWRENGSNFSSYLKTSLPVVQKKPENSSLLFKKDQNMVKVSEFHLPNTTPVLYLDCENAFNGLSEKEKLYAHHLSRACWFGSLICYVQSSVESPLIFVLIQKLFRHETVAQLERKAIEHCGFTEEEFAALLVYCAGFIDNTGNYKGFGDTKFVPNVPKEKFEALVRVSEAMELEKSKVSAVFEKCVDKMFSTADKEKQLGYWDVGVTKYLSKNFTRKDSEIVNAFLKAQNVRDIYNTRAFKTVDETGSSCYEIRLASMLSTNDPEQSNFLVSHVSNGHKFKITRGDYGKLLQYLNKELANAKNHVANETESEMLKHYISSFRTGSIESHKEGSRFWIKNKGPIVETYIGFIENYRDPAGMRAEFEGFVAVVNKAMSVKFADLVANAEKLLTLMPWPKNYEKDLFLKPDFTSLDVLTFATSGVPAGINIPNYDSIRQDEGFKNVSLGNVISAAYKSSNLNYLSNEDKELLAKYGAQSFEVQVGLHELLGHGSGKLLMENKGEFNFDIENVKDLETGDKVTSWYKDGEGYDSVFTSISSSYEECRAECVGLHLCDVPEVLKVYGLEGSVADDLVYANWLGMAHRGLESLQMYEPKTQSWMQAHSQARYVILQVLLEAGEDFVKIQETTGEDGNPDFLLTLDRSKIATVGKPAIAKFLMRLQLYKSTADIKNALEMYNKYSMVSMEGFYPFLKYRDVVMARKRPRRYFLQANTFVKDGKVALKTYEATHAGCIQAFVDCYAENPELDDVMEDLAEKERPYFS